MVENNPGKNIITVPIYDTQRVMDKTHDVSPVVLQSVRTISQTFGNWFPGLLSPLYIQLFMRPPARAKHRKEDELLRKVTRKSMTYGKLDIRVYEWQAYPNAPWIVLVHGWQSRGTALRHFVPALHELGYNVVAFDGPAHGESSGWKNNLILMSQVLHQVIDQYEEVKGVVGHSFGGATSSYLLSNELSDLSLDLMTFIATPTSMERIFQEFFDIVGAPDTLRERIIKNLQDKFELELDDVDTDKTVKKVKTKRGVIIHDERDRIVLPKNAEAILNARPDFTWLKPVGLGHFLPVKNKKVMEAYLHILNNPN
ncbi:MAG TPA: alpha/beta hydrolase [Saprospiraceae bacterium]|nr:alpha/beta hydrolase [Saprospiraceae bacterium]